MGSAIRGDSILFYKICRERAADLTETKASPQGALEVICASAPAPVWISWCQDKTRHYNTAEYEDVHVIVYGNTAIATGGFKGRGTDASGKPFEEHDR
jgi:hypothetical protein